MMSPLFIQVIWPCWFLTSIGLLIAHWIAIKCHLYEVLWFNFVWLMILHWPYFDGCGTQGGMVCTSNLIAPFIVSREIFGQKAFLFGACKANPQFGDAHPKQSAIGILLDFHCMHSVPLRSAIIFLFRGLGLHFGVCGYTPPPMPQCLPMMTAISDVCMMTAHCIRLAFLIASLVVLWANDVTSLYPSHLTMLISYFDWPSDCPLNCHPLPFVWSSLILFCLVEDASLAMFWWFAAFKVTWYALPT